MAPDAPTCHHGRVKISFLLLLLGSIWMSEYRATDELATLRFYAPIVLIMDASFLHGTEALPTQSDV